MVKENRSFSRFFVLALTLVAGVLIAVNPGSAFANEHKEGEKSCSGEKGEKSCDGEKKADHDKEHGDKEHGEHACNGEKH